MTNNYVVSCRVVRELSRYVRDRRRSRPTGRGRGVDYRRRLLENLNTRARHRRTVTRYGGQCEVFVAYHNKREKRFTGGVRSVHGKNVKTGRRSRLFVYLFVLLLFSTDRDAPYSYRPPNNTLPTRFSITSENANTCRSGNDDGGTGERSYRMKSDETGAAKTCVRVRFAWDSVNVTLGDFTKTYHSRARLAGERKRA